MVFLTDHYAKREIQGFRAAIMAPSLRLAVCHLEASKL